jgi:predicted aconitase with swiveling domain
MLAYQPATGWVVEPQMAIGPGAHREQKETSINRYIFKGRLRLSGFAEGPAEVSSVPFDARASFVDVSIEGAHRSLCRDPANEDLYKHDLTGKVLCMPQTIGSTDATLVWMVLLENSLAPKALCLAEPIEDTTASGVILGHHWFGRRLVTVDSLGDGFLSTVKTGDTVTIREDGTVEVRPARGFSGQPDVM